MRKILTDNDALDGVTLGEARSGRYT